MRKNIEELNKIKKYQRLANYITVLEMYLKDNLFLERELRKEDLKRISVGHWGCSPSINFLYSHLNSYSKRKNKKLKIVVGTGHAGASVMANLYLMGKTQYERNIKGLKRFISDFGTKIRTEINPSYNGTYYDGGELGYSLAFSYGMSLNTDDLVVCIFGDGEAETATLSASLKLVKLLKSNILPILNLNGLKMGSRSIYSLYTDSELINHFNSYGYKTFIVTNDKQMYKLLNKIEKYENPFIIYKNKKGFNSLDYIEGSLLSHKNPLSNLDENKKVKEIEKWLLSYRLDYFIDKDILDIIPKNKKDKLTKLKLPNIEKYESYKEEKSNITILKHYLRKVMYDNNFYLFSPDELVSNKLGDLKGNKVFEMLSENVLEGMYQGLVQSGGSGIYISYEAFMPIVSSMISQYLKYIYQSKKILREEKNGLTFVLTSTSYENNYSHQNPEFVNTLLDKEYDFINVLYPKDSNSLIKCVDKCLKLKDYINIITVSKGIQKQYQSLEESNIDIEVLIDHDEVDLVIAVTGDYLLNEAYKIINNSNKKIRLVYVTNLKVLDSNNRFKEALSDKEFNKYFGDKKVIYLFHGYKSVIRNLMFNRKVNIKIYGYMDKSDICGNVYEKINANFNIKEIVKEVGYE